MSSVKMRSDWGMGAQTHRMSILIKGGDVYTGATHPILQHNAGRRWHPQASDSQGQVFCQVSGGSRPVNTLVSDLQPPEQTTDFGD